MRATTAHKTGSASAPRLSPRAQALAHDLHPQRLPRHIAVIMDGNGRWARQRNQPRIFGHRKGVQAVRDTVTACRILGVPFLTLYAFSVENWRRPDEEIRALMSLLRRFLRSERQGLIDRDIRLNVVGRPQDLPPEVRETLDEVMAATADMTGMTLNLALSYGGRTEIVDAVNLLLADVREGRRDNDSISEADLARYLTTAGQPDPDLLIRTSGEMRVSNFLLWQIAYAEFHVTPVLWPDFRDLHLIEALLDYQQRERRFGRAPSVDGAL